MKIKAIEQIPSTSVAAVCVLYPSSGVIPPKFVTTQK